MNTLGINKIKKIWAECVFEGDDFEYELGLEPKLTHIPSEKAVKKGQNIKFIYVCAKLDDNDIIFKVLNRTEIVDIIKLQKTPNHLYFNDLKDPQHWMLKKIVLKQLSKTLPKEDLTLQKAISYDDNLESGESFYDFALQPTSVEVKLAHRPLNIQNLGQLKTNTKKRLASNTKFINIKDSNKKLVNSIFTKGKKYTLTLDNVINRRQEKEVLYNSIFSSNADALLKVSYYR